MECLAAARGASRRTRNYMNQGVRLLRVKGDRALVGDHDGRPVAWIPVSEIRELPAWAERGV